MSNTTTTRSKHHASDIDHSKKTVDTLARVKQLIDTQPQNVKNGIITIGNSCPAKLVTEYNKICDTSKMLAPFNEGTTYIQEIEHGGVSLIDFLFKYKSYKPFINGN